MIKDLTIINYCNKIYKIFIKDNSLYFSSQSEVLLINEDVDEYTVVYDDDIIWIANSVRANIILNKIIINPEDDSDVKHTVIYRYDSVFKDVRSLSLLVKGDKKLLFFLAYEKGSESAFIYKINFSNKIIVDIISRCCMDENSFKVCSDTEEDYMLICKNKSEGKYILYNLTLETNLINIDLIENCKVEFISFMGKLTILYWRNSYDIDTIQYKQIEKYKTSIYVEKEKNISISFKLSKIDVIDYFNRVYILGKKDNRVVLGTSTDLMRWKFKEFMKSSDINKIKIITNKNNVNSRFLSYSVIDEKKYEKQTVSKKIVEFNKDNSIEMLRRERYKVQIFKNVETIINLENYYGNVCNNYLDKINELLKVIEEKDNIILNLLDVK